MSEVTAPTPSRAGVGLAACAVFVAASIAPYFVTTLVPAHTGTGYIAIHAVMTAAMLMAWARGRAVPMQALILAGIAARLILLAAPMLSSNDAERYLWDGAVALAGFDPYSVPPADPLVAPMRAIWATPPEHAAYPTLYPPLAITLFALSALAGPVWGIWVWKAIATAAGIALVPLAARLLTRWQCEQHFALVALSPLLVLETGVGAHLDAIVALLVGGAMHASFQRRAVWVGGLLGVGVCVKFLPAIALMPLAIAMGWRAALRMGLAAIGAIAVIYGTALAIGWRPIGSLPVFFEKWRNGSPLFTLLEAWLPTPMLLAVIAVAGAVLLLTVMVFARQRPVIATQLAIATPLLLSPVAFPWYLLPLVPLAALGPGAALVGWLSLSPLVYEVRDRFVSDGVWMPAIWPLAIIGGGWMIGLGIDGLRHWRRRLALTDGKH